MRQTDYLIIGQGIAGMLFSHELLQRGYPFIAFDTGGDNATKTAAGMYNPVVLKRFTPVWQGHEQITTLQKTFSKLERLLGVKLDYPMPIWRVFHDENEHQTWVSKAQKPELTPLLASPPTANHFNGIIAPHGLGKVHFGGKIDLKTLSATYHRWLCESGRLLVEHFDYQRLKPHQNGWQYGDIVAKKVVCCEGYGIKNNPYFNNLPLKGNKGEVLTVHLPNFSLTDAVKSKAFIMPLPERGSDEYFVGATYHWHDKDTQPTHVAKTELLNKLQDFIEKDKLNKLQITSHHAGIRPTVIDRRPLLGQHQKHENLFILNGLGTRGVMLGATMAKWLIDFIEHAKPLPAEVDIQRFENL